jgi:signal transduction histidine kinase/CheY-like chemotaxis protein
VPDPWEHSASVLWDYAPAGRPGYLGVPGITPEEREAIERVKAGHGTFSIANELGSELFVKVDGEIGGTVSLLAKWLTDFFGARFEPRLLEWGDYIQGLQTGSLDFTAELTPTPDRMERYSMTSPINERVLVYVTVPGKPPLYLISRERPVRYITNAISITFEQARKALEGPWTVAEVEGHGEAYRLLAEGTADAFIAEEPYAASFARFGEVEVEEILPMVVSGVSLATPNRELAPLISAVQKAMDHGGGMDLFAGIYREGRLQFARDRFLRILTPEELAWVREHSGGGGRPILVGMEHDNYPLSFWNEPAGEFQGVAADLLAEIRELSGLALRPAFGGPRPWTEIYQLLEEGEISMVSELQRTPGREGMFLWPDRPYMTGFYAFLSLAGFPDQRLVDVKRLRIGLTEGAGGTELFRQWFPGHPRTFYYPDNLGPFEGLERGEVDLVMGSHHDLLSMMNYRERPYFKVNLPLSRSYGSYFGLARGEGMLRSVISKALSHVDVEAVAERWRSRVFDYRGAMARARMPFMVAMLALSACVIALLSFMFARTRKAGRLLEEAVAARTAELRRQIGIADRASRAKSDFLARTSHEIRTPMNAIIGFAELAEREYGKLKALEYIRGIRSAGASLLAIINDILDFSKIEAGGLQLATSRYRVASVLNDVLTLIRVRMTDGQVRLETEFSPDLPSVLAGDSGRVRQILLNLLTNAVKYTRRGRIRFSAVSERVGPDEARLTFEVEDTGVGIRPEDMARLFSEFTRLDEKANIGVEGTGLGLAIARSLCLAMGGEISAESVYGEGSVFRAELRQRVIDWTPLGSFSEEADPSPEAVRASFTAPGAEVLVVDDYGSNLMVAEGLMVPYGMRLSFASGGLEAVGLVREGSYDLILMDHMMPGMDGMEACRAIRSLEGGEGIPIVALTANAVAGMREMYLENGFDDFLSKPIDPAALDACLSRWIPVVKRRPAPPAEGSPEPAARAPAGRPADPWQWAALAATGRAGGPPPQDPPARGPVIEGVDTRQGVLRAGGVERYLRLLAAFLRDAEGAAPLLDRALDGITGGDAAGLRRFTTEAHALKSALANIGAAGLSAAAARLEAAGHGGDLALIRAELPDFREGLARLSDRIRGAVSLAPGRAPGRPGTPPAAGEGAAVPLADLREALRELDIPRAYAALVLLQAEAAGTPQEEPVEAIANDILTADYDKALEALEALR